MEKILLVSANFIKNVTNIDDNMPGKLIEPAIYEAQVEGLRTVLGDALVDRLEELVRTDEIDQEGYEMYKALLTKCQYYLTYTVMANICMLTAVKVSPAGLEQVSENIWNHWIWMIVSDYRVFIRRRQIIFVISCKIMC